ncbi:MAG: PIN domain-containing protein [Chloroflexota bacterium]
MSDKQERQFVDTNVLVYAHDQSAEGKHQQAGELVASLWQSEEGCLSVQVLQEFYVTVTRKLKRPLPPNEAAQLIADLGLWRVHRPTVTDILDAIQLQERYQVSFWDAMILQSAAQLKCSIVWSEDLNDGQIYGQVRVQNPFSHQYDNV